MASSWPFSVRPQSQRSAIAFIRRAISPLALVDRDLEIRAMCARCSWIRSQLLLKPIRVRAMALWVYHDEPVLCKVRGGLSPLAKSTAPFARGSPHGALGTEGGATAVLQAEQVGAGGASDRLLDRLSPAGSRSGGFCDELLLGDCLTELGRYQEAEQLLLEGYRVLREEQDQAARDAVERLVSLYDAWGKPDLAAEYRALQEKFAEAAAP